MLPQTLQDNSYRNETFAAVSGIPLADVNALEVFLFNALHYDVVIDGDDWESWIYMMKDQWSKGIAMGKDMGQQAEVGAALARLVRVAGRRNKGSASTFINSTPVKASRASASTATPLTSSLMSRIDLDASGPLRSYASGSLPPAPASRVYCQQETPTRPRGEKR